MEALLQWGLDLIIIIQQVRGPELDGLFRVASFLGEPEFHLLVLPLLFWCVDFGLGARVSVFLLLSSHLNLYLKALFQQPRPFDFDPSLQLIPVESYGLPSGHAQLAVVVWGGIAGYVEAGEKPLETALKEMREEAGLEHEDVVLIKRMDPMRVADVYEGINYEWVIHPFLFKIEKKDKVHIDWEHTEYRWISPRDIRRYKTVPRLKEIVKNIFK